MVKSFYIKEIIRDVSNEIFNIFESDKYNFKSIHDKYGLHWDYKDIIHFNIFFYKTEEYSYSINYDYFRFNIV